ncbi:hypothetical protein JCM3775_006379 [Rhodotorula graminis]
MSDDDSDTWNPLEDDDDPCDWTGDLDLDSDQLDDDDVDDDELAPLAEFRQLWTEQLSQEQHQGPQHTPAPSRPRPARHFHPVLSNPDLVDLICAHPELSLRDLRSLALVDTVVGAVARRRLFRTVSISTPTRAHEYLALSRASSLPPPSTLDVSLADYRSILAETEAFQVLVAWKGVKEDRQNFEWYYDGAGRSVRRQPWLNDLYRKLGEDAPPERLEAARRAQQRAWARRVIEAPPADKCEADLPGGPMLKEQVCDKVVGSVFQTWPFTPRADATAVGPDLADLFRLSQKRLTLSHPLSHYVTPLAPILASTSTLEHLHIVGAEYEHGDTVDPSFCGGPCVVQVNASHRGFVGAPSRLVSVELESLQLAVLDVASAGDASGDGQDEGEREWGPERVHLEHVVARPQTATARARPPPPLRFWRSEADQYSHDDELEPLRTRFLCLDLFTFLGRPALTSLRLVDVHGAIPSTIYLAVQRSGASLRHLELVDVNSKATAQEGWDRQPYVPIVKHVFRIASSDASSSPSSPLGAFATDSAALDAVIAERTHLPSPPLAPLHPSQRTHAASSLPSLSLASALRHCTSLRTLRLTSTTFALPPAEPSYPPDLLDALLAAHPPLELLHWRVGVPDGRTSAGEWARFAERLESLSGELGTLDVGESEVWMALKRPARGSGARDEACGVM